jgi:hypothetical protein
LATTSLAPLAPMTTRRISVFRRISFGSLQFRVMGLNGLVELVEGGSVRPTLREAKLRASLYRPGTLFGRSCKVAIPPALTSEGAFCRDSITRSMRRLVYAIRPLCRRISAVRLVVTESRGKSSQSCPERSSCAWFRSFLNASAATLDRSSRRRRRTRPRAATPRSRSQEDPFASPFILRTKG